MTMSQGLKIVANTADGAVLLVVLDGDIHVAVTELGVEPVSQGSVTPGRRDLSGRGLSRMNLTLSPPPSGSLKVTVYSSVSR
ncbi:hypothetical protein [Desulfofundulus sp.]|uniref:hypothetical protein n=1 Tax=Desulfofundulus sp. TaxID=2282750 RepID=UPI003C784CAA